MKNTILIFFLFIGYNTFAQQTVDKPEIGKMEYSAKDSVVADAENNILRLFGGVDFKVDKVHFKADQVVVDRTNKSIVATGLLELFSAPMIKSHINSSNRILKYTFGDNAVVVE